MIQCIMHAPIYRKFDDRNWMRNYVKQGELSVPIPDESEFRINSGKAGTTYHKETLNLNTFK